MKMSPATHQPIYLVTLMTIVLTQIVTGLRMEFSPKIVNQLIAKEANIKCLSNRSRSIPGHVFMMRLNKKGEEDSYVSLTKSSYDYGKRSRKHIVVEGSINRMESYITMTIKNPKEADAGTYVCRVFYMANNTLEEGRVEANLIVDNNNDKVVIIHLLKKLSKAEKIAELQEDFGRKQEDSIKKLKEEEKQQEDAIKELTEHTKQKEDNIQQLKEQTEQLQHEKDEMERLEKQLKKIAPKNSTLGTTNNCLLVNAAIEICVPTETSAFRASYSAQDKVVTNETLVNRDISVNIGQNFNNGTWTFTAPKRGVYFFSLSAMTFSGLIHIKLMVNDRNVAGLYADKRKYYTQTSVTALTALEAGDEVRPHVVGFLLQNRLQGDGFTTFSGHLISRL